MLRLNLAVPPSGNAQTARHRGRRPCRIPQRAPGFRRRRGDRTACCRRGDDPAGRPGLHAGRGHRRAHRRHQEHQPALPGQRSPTSAPRPAGTRRVPAPRAARRRRQRSTGRPALPATRRPVHPSAGPPPRRPTAWHPPRTRSPARGRYCSTSAVTSVPSSSQCPPSLRTSRWRSARRARPRPGPPERTNTRAGSDTASMPTVTTKVALPSPTSPVVGRRAPVGLQYALVYPAVVAGDYEAVPGAHRRHHPDRNRRRWPGHPGLTHGIRSAVPLAVPQDVAEEFAGRLSSWPQRSPWIAAVQRRVFSRPVRGRGVGGGTRSRSLPGGP